MDTYTEARGKTGIVLFILTLVTTVIIAAGLIWVTTSDGAPDLTKGFANADAGWSKNITGSAYPLMHGQIEEHIRESQEALEEHIQQSGERLDSFLNRN